MTDTPPQRRPVRSSCARVVRSGSQSLRSPSRVAPLPAGGGASFWFGSLPPRRASRPSRGVLLTTPDARARESSSVTRRRDERAAALLSLARRGPSVAVRRSRRSRSKRARERESRRPCLARSSVEGRGWVTAGGGGAVAGSGNWLVDTARSIRIAASSTKQARRGRARAASVGGDATARRERGANRRRRGGRRTAARWLCASPRTARQQKRRCRAPRGLRRAARHHPSSLPATHTLDGVVTSLSSLLFWCLFLPISTTAAAAAYLRRRDGRARRGHDHDPRRRRARHTLRVTTSL